MPLDAASILVLNTFLRKGVGGRTIRRKSTLVDRQGLSGPQERAQSRHVVLFAMLWCYRTARRLQVH